MHLARLRLNPANGQARRDLSNPYEMHRTLVRAFVKDENDSPARFLWRLQLDGMWARPDILVQSAQRGNWDALESFPGYLASSVESKQIALESLLKEGRRYRFRLRANPTVCRNGKRRGLVGEDAQLAWLLRLAPRYGFQAESVLVTSSETMMAFKEGRPVTLRTATYEGLMVCTDVKLLENALLQGIGRGKAFGLGLLSIAAAGIR
jgi:CRISPR system Cascade subunit CasE